MNICIVAGGTGGHIYPGLALAFEYYHQGHSIYYIGSEKRMESKIVKNTPFTFLNVHNDGFRKGIKHNVKVVFDQFSAILLSRKLLKEHKIDLVIAFGGFITFPVSIAARFLKIPYFLHEQNAIAGKANLMVEKKAQGVVVCYEKALQEFKNKNTVLLGNPRASEVAQKEKDPSILNKMKLKSDIPIVYVVMGSLGSKPFYDKLVDMLLEYKMKDVQFVISGGIRAIDEYQQKVDGLENVHFYEFVDQVSLLPFCKLVISRSGATSVAELMASETPSIFIPSPYVTKNHQYFNAIECVNKGAALMLEDKDVTKESLYNIVHSTLNNEALLASLKKGCSKIAYKDSSQNIINWIEETLHG